jgi:hypothetical protein
LLGEQATSAGERAAGELLKRARVIRRQREQAQTAVQEAGRIEELEAFAPQAESAWNQARQLAEQGSASAYDEALELLVKLHDLAIYQGTEEAFARRMQTLRRQYEGRHAALHRRLDEAGLP